MEYTSYKDAYDALVQDNDGILPDLYETTDITIYGDPYTSAGKLTVADIVAHALVEVSTPRPVAPSTLPSVVGVLYAALPPAGPLYLDKLLDQTVASLN